MERSEGASLRVLWHGCRIHEGEAWHELVAVQWRRTGVVDEEEVAAGRIGIDRVVDSKGVDQVLALTGWRWRSERAHLSREGILPPFDVRRVGKEGTRDAAQRRVTV
jgi:hypothetical protein